MKHNLISFYETQSDCIKSRENSPFSSSPNQRVHTIAPYYNDIEKTEDM